MQKEGMDDLGERIKALEENQLKIAKEFSKQNVSFFYALSGMRVAALKEDKYKTFEGYMKFKMEEASRYIGSAQNVEEVISLTDQYTDNCIAYAESLLNK
jgi:hypothetical protein